MTTPPIIFENEIIDELRCHVDMVISEYTREIDELTNKLKEVSEYASRVDEMEAEHAKCISELQREKNNFYRSTIDEITSRFRVAYYKPVPHLERPEKCNACNNSRKIAFVSPISGKMMEDTCPVCGEYTESYTSEETKLYKFKFRFANGGNITVLPFYRHNDDDYGLEGDPTMIIKSTDKTPEMNLKWTYLNKNFLFESKEMCDEFCHKLTLFCKDGAKL